MRGKDFTPFPILKTERLTLRQLIISDENEIFALRSDTNVNKYLDRKLGQSIDEARNFIKTINENIKRNDSIYWAITLNDTDKLIGTICLFNFSDENLKVEIGYELLPDFQGKGIMQEAASKVIDFGNQYIGLNSIEAHTHSKNQSSVGLLEKLDFKKESTVDDHFMIFKLTNTGR
jgi:ribosomal-protein-alanine N-acetyltransferase